MNKTILFTTLGRVNSKILDCAVKDFIQSNNWPLSRMVTPSQIKWRFLILNESGWSVNQRDQLNICILLYVRITSVCIIYKLCKQLFTKKSQRKMQTTLLLNWLLDYSIYKF
jgi:hypothetical protein